jgi:hypothetical protein
MTVNVDKTYSTDNITLNYIAGVSQWELTAGYKERIFFSCGT